MAKADGIFLGLHGRTFFTCIHGADDAKEHFCYLSLCTQQIYGMAQQSRSWPEIQPVSQSNCAKPLQGTFVESSVGLADMFSYTIDQELHGTDLCVL